IGLSRTPFHLLSSALKFVFITSSLLSSFSSNDLPQFSTSLFRYTAAEGWLTESPSDLWWPQFSVRMTLATSSSGNQGGGATGVVQISQLAATRRSRQELAVGGVQDRERKRKQAEVEVRGVAEEGSYERWRRRWRAEVSIATPVGKRQRKWVRHRQIGELGIGAVGGREDDSNIEDDGENGLEGRPISGKQEQGITTPLVAKKTDKRGGVIVNTGELSKKVKSVSFNGTPIRTVLLRNMNYKIEPISFKTSSIVLLQISCATLFNLSLLTSDIWAVVMILCTTERRAQRGVQPLRIQILTQNINTSLGKKIQV
ncbi:DNA-damage-repair/toleration protein DRT111, partial [Striga asiatica]